MDQGLFIKATGHITAGLCVDLRNLVYDRLESPTPPARVLVDLSGCDYMDSTFMGLLVGFNKKLLSLKNVRLQLNQPSEECLKLLNSLGILRLLEVLPQPEPEPAALKLISQHHSPTAEMLLTAHEELSRLSDENKKKFSALQNILKQKLDRDPQDP